MKRPTYYFSHDADARDDPKCVLLVEAEGQEGYGIFWTLLEILRGQTNYRYPLSLLPAIARRHNTTAEKMQSVIENYNLFTVENGEFFSESLNRRMGIYEEKKVKRSIAGKKGMQTRWTKSETDSGTDNNVITPLYQSDNNVITKDNKEKKIKRKEKNIEEEKNILKKEIEITHSLQKYIKDNFERVSQMPKQLTEKECDELIKNYSKIEIKETLEQMENWGALLTGKSGSKPNQSVCLTLKNWINKERKRNASNKPTYKPNSNGNSTYSKRLELTLDDLERSERENFIVGAN